MVDFASARRMMVDGQIRTSDVTDPSILAAMAAVPRELFVPANKAGLAYLDRDLAVSPGGPDRPARHLLKPMMLAKLLQAAEIGPADRVLDIGCATGYSTAVLTRLAGQVVVLEEDRALATAAGEALGASGCANVLLRIGPLVGGAPADGPYDAIIINGAIEQLPDPLGAQLKDRGRLVCILGGGPGGKAMLYRSAGGALSGRPLFDAAGPMLPGFAKPLAFVF